MSEVNTQFISSEKKQELEQELKLLKSNTIPDLANRIDEAKQLGDLSENAEYHAAREEMAWTRSRIKEIENILDQAQIIERGTQTNGEVKVGSTLVIKTNSGEKEFTIVGMQDADPAVGKISNESPLGQALLGRRAGDRVEIKVPVGTQIYTILSVK